MPAALLTRLRARWSPRTLLDRHWISEAAALLLLVAAALVPSTKRRLALLATAARRTETAFSRALARRLLNPWLNDSARRGAWREHRIGWDRYYGEFVDIEADRALTTSLVLKEPGPAGEKGVLYSSFEFNWMRLIANHDAKRLLSEYLLVGASSWSPGDHAVLASLQGLSDDPVFVGISNHSDIEQYGIWEAGGGTVPLPITAGDWIDPAMYRPKARDTRDIDVVMVSHFAPWKRHWLLFDALRRMRRDLRVVLIGRVDARTEEDILREARAFGVQQRLEIYKNLEVDEVAAMLCNSRVAVALSKREGSCVTVTEAMFADTPVVMMADAHIGTRVYINALTGHIATRSNLPSILSAVIKRPTEFAPRQWALDHVSAGATSARLNHILRDHCLHRGMPWTCDITPMCWRYVPQYLNPADEARMRPAVERLRRDYGIVLTRFAGERVTAMAQQRARASAKVTA